MSNYIGLWVILICITLFSVISGSFTVFYFGLGVSLLGWWGLRATSRKLGIKEDISGGTGFAKTELLLKLRISNPSWFPVFWCTASRAFSQELGSSLWQSLVSIKPHGSVTMKMSFFPEQRGIYNVPDLIITTGDPFGWKETSIHIASPEKIIVYPPLSAVEGLFLHRHLPWGHTKVLFGLHEDPSRLKGCRDYYPGDSLKKIHWPSLARTGQLKVKEWETTLAAEIGIFLNLAEADFPVSDWYWLSESEIEFAASLVHHLIGRKETPGLYCNGKLAGTGLETVFKFPPQNGHEQGKRILTFLAGVALHEHQPYLPLFQEAYRLKNGSCLLFITPRISMEMVKHAQNLKHAGYHPLFLWLESSGGVLPRAELQGTGIPWYSVAKRRDNHAFFITRIR
jgi:uncharacterized protein (DUF58 family)